MHQELQTFFDSKSKIPYLHINQFIYENVEILELTDTYLKFNATTDLMTFDEQEQKINNSSSFVEVIARVEDISMLEKVLFRF